MMVYTFNPNTISMNLRPSWSTLSILGQPEIHAENSPPISKTKQPKNPQRHGQKQPAGMALPVPALTLYHSGGFRYSTLL